MSVTTAVRRCCVTPRRDGREVGCNRARSHVRGPVESPQAPVNSPANATATSTRAMRVRVTSVCRVRLIVTLFIELLLTLMRVNASGRGRVLLAGYSKVA